MPTLIFSRVGACPLCSPVPAPMVEQLIHNPGHSAVRERAFLYTFSLQTFGLLTIVTKITAPTLSVHIGLSFGHVTESKCISNS